MPRQPNPAAETTVAAAPAEQPQVRKSEQVRQAWRAHPRMEPKEITALLQAQGLDVTSAYVSGIKFQMNKNKGKNKTKVAVAPILEAGPVVAKDAEAAVAAPTAVTIPLPDTTQADKVKGKSGVLVISDTPGVTLTATRIPDVSDLEQLAKASGVAAKRRKRRTKGRPKDPDRPARERKIHEYKRDNPRATHQEIADVLGHSKHQVDHALKPSRNRGKKS